MHPANLPATLQQRRARQRGRTVSHAELERRGQLAFNFDLPARLIEQRKGSSWDQAFVGDEYEKAAYVNFCGSVLESYIADIRAGLGSLRKQSKEPACGHFDSSAATAMFDALAWLSGAGSCRLTVDLVCACVELRVAHVVRAVADAYGLLVTEKNGRLVVGLGEGTKRELRKQFYQNMETKK